MNTESVDSSTESECNWLSSDWRTVGDFVRLVEASEPQDRREPLFALSSKLYKRRLSVACRDQLQRVLEALYVPGQSKQRRIVIMCDDLLPTETLMLVPILMHVPFSCITHCPAERSPAGIGTVTITFPHTPDQMYEINAEN